MAELTNEQLFDLSDEELEAAFKEAKAQEQSPDDGFQEEAADEVIEDVEDSTEEDVETEDEEEVELEYPEDDQDSDDDASSDDTDEEETEDDSDEEDVEPDEDTEPEEEQTSKEEDDSEDYEQPVDEVLRFKANGQDYEFTLDEMKGQFGRVFGQAMDYTKKMQAIKPYRKTIDAIEQAGLNNDDVNFMIDVLKGDKEAIAELIKRTGTDTLELDTENTNYVPKDYGRNDTELDIKDIVDDISRDKEYTVTHNILEKQWDDKSRDAFIEDPNLIRLLHTDVKSGMFDTINPIAQKLKVYDGATKSDLDYYKEAAHQYFDKQAQEEARREATANKAAEAEKAAQEAERVAAAKAKQEKQIATKKASTKRKAAAPSKKTSGSKKVVDYLDDSDEAFEDWYSKLQDAM